MELSPQQEVALERARQWFNDPLSTSQVFRVFGYAGTGKTTIAKAFQGMVNGMTLFACYTGKAAHVLRTKGCMGAMTLHSLIYIPKSKSAERLRELQREYIKQSDMGSSPDILMLLREEITAEQANVKRPAFALNPDSALRSADLLIVDEVSMVNEEMALDLLSYGVKILVLGDPAQLPPVMGGGYFTNCAPDVMLTEVHRQAAFSPILRAATEVRQGTGLGGELAVPRGTLKIAELAAFNQILVGTNKSRQVINAKVREHYGFVGEMPTVGDRLICTRNDTETGLLNGSQWMVRDVHHHQDTGRLGLTIKGVDSEEMLNVEAHSYPFRGEEIPYFETREAQCFDYAYALTVHKSQGSQFDTVVLIDESNKFPQHQRRAWLYTGITRAAKELTIIR